jgi:hypothetical protein
VISRHPRNRPRRWVELRSHARPWWVSVFRRVDWCWEWVAWALSNWAFLEVLEYLGTFSVLVAVIFYFAETRDRIRQRHYQAWQVINTAQGKGGSGGRIDALQELNKDGVPLIGVDASQAFLQGVSLERAMLERCDLHAADMRASDLHGANLNFCNLASTNLRGANLAETQLDDADLTNADLNGSNLAGADLSRTDLSRVDLRGANLRSVTWTDVQSFQLTNLYAVRDAPVGFVDYAIAHGAVALQPDAEWQRRLDAASPSK